MKNIIAWGKRLLWLLPPPLKAKLKLLIKALEIGLLAYKALEEHNHQKRIKKIKKIYSALQDSDLDVSVILNANRERENALNRHTNTIESNSL